MRKGGASIVPTILSLAAEYGIQSTRTSAAAVESQLATAQALADLSSSIGLAQKSVDDYVFGLQSAAWGASTSLYTFLRRLAKNDGALATGLAPVTQFFTFRSAAVKANHPKTAQGKAALKARKSAVSPSVSAWNGSAPVASS